MKKHDGKGEEIKHTQRECVCVGVCVSERGWMRSDAEKNVPPALGARQGGIPTLCLDGERGRGGHWRGLSKTNGGQGRKGEREDKRKKGSEKGGAGGTNGCVCPVQSVLGVPRARESAHFTRKGANNRYAGLSRYDSQRKMIFKKV